MRRSLQIFFGHFRLTHATNVTWTKTSLRKQSQKYPTNTSSKTELTKAFVNIPLDLSNV